MYEEELGIGRPRKKMVEWSKGNNIEGMHGNKFINFSKKLAEEMKREKVQR